MTSPTTPRRRWFSIAALAWLGILLPFVVAVLTSLAWCMIYDGPEGSETSVKWDDTTSIITVVAIILGFALCLPLIRAHFPPGAAKRAGIVLVLLGALALNFVMVFIVRFMAYAGFGGKFTF
jgi:hypothetical protein